MPSFGAQVLKVQRDRLRDAERTLVDLMLRENPEFVRKVMGERYHAAVEAVREAR